MIVVEIGGHWSFIPCLLFQHIWLFSCGILVFSFMCVCVCVQACTCFQFWSLFLLKSSIVEIIRENMKRMIALPRRECWKVVFLFIFCLVLFLFFFESKVLSRFFLNYLTRGWFFFLSLPPNDTTHSLTFLLKHAHFLSFTSMFFFFPCKFFFGNLFCSFVSFFIPLHIAISLIIAIIERIVRKAHNIAQIFLKFCCMLNGYFILFHFW